MQLSREEGARHTLICDWVKRYQEFGEEGIQPRKRSGNPYAALTTGKSLSEVERLRLLVMKQEIEIERLKKGYWVEGAGVNKEYVTGCGKSTRLPQRSK